MQTRARQTLRFNDASTVERIEAAAATSCRKSVQAAIQANTNCHEIGREAATGRGEYKYATVASQTAEAFTLVYPKHDETCEVLEALGARMDALAAELEGVVRAAMHEFERAHPVVMALTGLLWTDGHFKRNGMGLTVCACSAP